jgi:hypothetical protein
MGRLPITKQMKELICEIGEMNVLIGFWSNVRQKIINGNQLTLDLCRLVSGVSNVELFGMSDSSVHWSDSEADPLGDLMDWNAHVMNQSGYAPTQIIVSSKKYEQIDRLDKWLKHMNLMLEALPRRRFIRRYQINQLLGNPRSKWLKHKKRRFHIWLDKKRHPEEWI